MRDALVVGGGLAGLAAACRLADRGHPTTLVEARPRLGGRLRGPPGPLGTPAFAVLAEGRRGPLARLFHDLGEGFAVAPLASPRVALGGEWERLPERAPDLARTRFLGWHGAREWWGADRNLRRWGREGGRGATVLEAVGPLASEEAEALLAARAGVHGLVADLDRASASMLARRWAERRGARPRWCLPAGGYDGVVERLRDRFLAAGGSLRVATRVTRVAPLGGAGEGFVASTSGGEERARAVVLAVDPVRAADLAGPALPGAAASSLRALQPVAGLRVEAALRRAPTESRSLLAAAEPFGLGFVATNVDEAAARGAEARLSWFMPLAAHRVADEAYVRAARHHVHALLEGLFPGLWADSTEVWAGPALAAHAAPLVGQEDEALPPSDAGPPGLAFAGDWVRGVGGGVEGAVRSALEAALRVEEALAVAKGGLGARAARSSR